MLKAFLVMFLCLLASCASSCGKVHMPTDPYPNYADLNYYDMEFDVVYPGKEPQKQLGIATIKIDEEQPLDGIYLDFFGLYTGTIALRSQSCPVNYSVSFNGTRRFALRDLMPIPMTCTIEMVMSIDKINGLEHKMTQLGKLDIIMIPKNKRPLGISYLKSSIFGIKSVMGAGNLGLQRMEGGTTRTENVTIYTDSEGGGQYTITNSCDKPTLNGLYKDKTINFSLKDLYGGVSELKYQQGCEFYFMLIPLVQTEPPKNYLGRLLVNVYSNKVVPLEYASYKIDKKKISAWGNSYIAMTGINGAYSKVDDDRINNKSSTKYYSTNKYWIRAITVNGRKSVFLIQNNQVIWW